MNEFRGAGLMPPDLRPDTGSEFTEFRDKPDLLKVGSINSIFYFLHKTAEPFNCLEQDNLA